MKQIILVLALLLSSMVFGQSKMNLYQFKVKDIEGNDFDLSTLKGKKVLIVNTASKCGFTPQYEDLEKLFQTYKDKNFTIVGFPANNFLKQEPGTNEEIAEFCKRNYGVSFPMMAKISVKGDDIDPLYQWLTSEKENGHEDAPIKWNFQKFMIDEEGNWVDFVSPNTKPFDEKIVNWIEGK